MVHGAAAETCKRECTRMLQYMHNKHFDKKYTTLQSKIQSMNMVRLYQKSLVVQSANPGLKLMTRMRLHMRVTCAYDMARHGTQLTSALRSGVRCWPRCVHAHSTTSDRHRVVESEPIVATKRCHTAGFIAVSFCHDTVLGRVGIRARALNRT